MADASMRRTTPLGLCAERHANADLLRSLRDRLRQHAVDACGGEQQRDGRERSEDHQGKSPIGHGIREDAIER